MFPGHNHLLTTDTDDLTLWLSSKHQWLAGAVMNWRSWVWKPALLNLVLSRTWTKNIHRKHTSGCYIIKFPNVIFAIFFILTYFYLPPAVEKQWEVLFWVPTPSPVSPETFCLISQLLLKLTFWNLSCAIYARKKILLKCFHFFFKLQNCWFDNFFLFFLKNLVNMEFQKLLGGFSQKK